MVVGLGGMEGGTDVLEDVVVVVAPDLCCCRVEGVGLAVELVFPLISQGFKGVAVAMFRSNAHQVGSRTGIGKKNISVPIIF